MGAAICMTPHSARAAAISPALHSVSAAISTTPGSYVKQPFAVDHWPGLGPRRAATPPLLACAGPSRDHRLAHPSPWGLNLTHHDIVVQPGFARTTGGASRRRVHGPGRDRPPRAGTVQSRLSRLRPLVTLGLTTQAVTALAQEACPERDVFITVQHRFPAMPSSGTGDGRLATRLRPDRVPSLLTPLADRHKVCGQRCLSRPLWGCRRGCRSRSTENWVKDDWWAGRAAEDPASGETRKITHRLRCRTDASQLRLDGPVGVFKEEQC
jgi:hypothetical protein